MGLFRSKKFYTALAGTIGVVLSHFFGIDEATTMQIAGIVIALLVGQGLKDFGAAVK